MRLLLITVLLLIVFGSAYSQQPESRLPSYLDYGTDMSSLMRYDMDLKMTSLEECEKGVLDQSPDAFYCLARRGNEKSRLDMLKRAAAGGHPRAKNDYAIYLDNLDGPTKEKFSKEIHQLIMEAAESGLPHAQVTVGWWSVTGENGFTKNYSNAMSWNLLGYKQGHSEGANNIGELYEKGLGVPKDIDLAKAWYRKASALGNAEATDHLKRVGASAFSTKNINVNVLPERVFDFELEMEKIPKNGPAVNFEIMKAAADGSLPFGFEAFLSMKREDQDKSTLSSLVMDCLKRAVMLVLVDDNSVLKDILGKATNMLPNRKTVGNDDWADVRAVLNEFSSTYFRIYGKPPKLVRITSEQWRQILLNRR